MIQRSTEAAAEPKTILVVDDEIEIRFVIADYLREAGFKVIAAGSADEALEYLTSPNEVGLVFSDVNMPGTLDGIALAHKLRANYPKLRVLLTSGHFSQRSVDVDLMLIPKPYVLAEVRTTIHEMLGMLAAAVSFDESPSGGE